MRKRILLIALLSASTTYAQQIGNSDLESWDNLGSSSEEPTNWNSFKTADCTLGSIICGIAQNQQVSRSTDVRPGSIGMYSARVYSLNVLGNNANGNLTLGRVHMGNTDPLNASNYNFSITSDVNYSEALTESPDSLVFWVKYNAASSEEARVSGVLHDNYDYKDGYNVDAGSSSHLVAEISYNYAPTNGAWVRKSVPWDYVGPASNNTYILLTFTTNKTPGGGASSDEVLIDDIELIYNSSASLYENSLLINPVTVSNNLSFHGGENDVNFKMFNGSGQEVLEGNTTGVFDVSRFKGIYFIQLQKEGNLKTVKIIL